MPDFSYQKNAQKLSAVGNNLERRANALNEYNLAKNEHIQLGNERAQNIAQGKSLQNIPNWFQMKAKELMTLNPLAAEAGIPQQRTIDARGSAWEALAKQAEAAAQSGQPFKPDFRY